MRCFKFFSQPPLRCCSPWYCVIPGCIQGRRLEFAIVRGGTGFKPGAVALELGVPPRFLILRNIYLKCVKEISRIVSLVIPILCTLQYTGLVYDVYVFYKCTVPVKYVLWCTHTFEYKHLHIVNSKGKVVQIIILTWTYILYVQV